MDAIDAVLVSFSGSFPRLLQSYSCPLPQKLRGHLLNLALGEANQEIELLGQCDTELGIAFAETVLALLDKANCRPCDVRAIGSHGQTIRHRPDNPWPFSLQIGDPNIISERTQITTVADFRRRDIAAGGQGAPLVPAFHHAVFASRTEHRCVLNIGGIANISYLPADGKRVMGFDTGPGNVLLDSWIRRNLGDSFDRNGQWAASVVPDVALVEILLSDPYLKLSPPKSTGRELFNLDWLDNHLQGCNVDAATVQSSLCELSARSIADAVRQYAPLTQRLLVCGGGAYNIRLMQRIADLLAPLIVQSTTDFGIEPDWVEAVAFAWLAKAALEKRPGNLVSVTGANKPVVLGGIYPA